MSEDEALNSEKGGSKDQISNSSSRRRIRSPRARGRSPCVKEDNEEGNGVVLIGGKLPSNPSRSQPLKAVDDDRGREIKDNSSQRKELSNRTGRSVSPRQNTSEHARQNNKSSPSRPLPLLRSKTAPQEGSSSLGNARSKAAAKSPTTRRTPRNVPRGRSPETSKKRSPGEGSQRTGKRSLSPNVEINDEKRSISPATRRQGGKGGSKQNTLERQSSNNKAKSKSKSRSPLRKTTSKSSDMNEKTVNSRLPLVLPEPSGELAPPTDDESEFSAQNPRFVTAKGNHTHLQLDVSNPHQLGEDMPVFSLLDESLLGESESDSDENDVKRTTQMQHSSHRSPTRRRPRARSRNRDKQSSSPTASRGRNKTPTSPKNDPHPAAAHKNDTSATPTPGPAPVPDLECKPWECNDANDKNSSSSTSMNTESSPRKTNFMANMTNSPKINLSPVGLRKAVKAIKYTKPSMANASNFVGSLSTGFQQRLGLSPRHQPMEDDDDDLTGLLDD